MGADVVDLSTRRIEEREPDITATVRVYIDGGVIHEFCEVDARGRVSSDLARLLTLSAFRNVEHQWRHRRSRKGKRDKVTARARNAR